MNEKELLRECFQIAMEAKKSGNGPFGALILTDKEEIIARAGNSTTQKGSIIYHAEINAIQQAEQKIGKGNLSGCTLIASAEPCPMCASAIIWSGLSRVVYGVSIPAMQQAGIVQIDINSEIIFEKSSHEIEIVGPLIEEEGLMVFS